MQAARLKAIKIIGAKGEDLLVNMAHVSLVSKSETEDGRPCINFHCTNLTAQDRPVAVFNSNSTRDTVFTKISKDVYDCVYKQTKGV